ncbi:hypothetical protein CRE_27628 [Caenorhabditis remanei]|nr:hypothetical protein CRE_27628 [Caenorhabditis remanei]
MTTAPKYRTAWNDDIESMLVELVSETPCLWRVKNEKDIGGSEEVEFTVIKMMVTKKWLEFTLLFDVKYALNGYKMADRGKIKNRDGSVKEDLTEKWIHFHKLDFLIDPNAGKFKKPKK